MHGPLSWALLFQYRKTKNGAAQKGQPAVLAKEHRDTIEGGIREKAYRNGGECHQKNDVDGLFLLAW